MIKTTCPSCEASLNVKDEYLGKKARCPKCGDTLIVARNSEVAHSAVVPWDQFSDENDSNTNIQERSAHSFMAGGGNQKGLELLEPLHKADKTVLRLTSFFLIVLFAVGVILGSATMIDGLANAETSDIQFGVYLVLGAFPCLIFRSWINLAVAIERNTRIAADRLGQLSPLQAK